MHPAYSVILFTTASGAGYGLLALLAMVAFAHGKLPVVIRSTSDDSQGIR